MIGRNQTGIRTSHAERFIAGTLAAVLAGLSVPSAWAAVGWEAAAFPGEGKRTIQGCAARYSDEAYSCLFIRCDGPGRLSLHASAPGADISGPVRLSIDGATFAVTFGKNPPSPLPMSNRADTFPEPLLAAMKTGRSLKILDAKLTVGYDVIPLRNAAPAIGRIEKFCGMAGDASAQSRKPGEAYREAVSARCEAKRLDWLNPGILVDGIDGWVEALPPEDKRRVEAHAKPALAKCEMGASCPNSAYIAAAEAFGMVDGLATAVCAMPYRCSAPFTCSEP